MATVVELRLPLTEFPLGAVIERDPSRRIELERIVPANGRLLPFFWVWGVDDEGDEDADGTEEPDGDVGAELRENRAVRALEEVTRTADGRLYRARWNETIAGFVRGISEIGGTILLGRGTETGWRFELRFPDREAARQFQSYCRERDVAIELRRINSVRKRRAGKRYQLTDDQRETIRRAYERGYFEQPRGATQTELAAEFDVGQRAISRRLYRGLSRLVGHTVAADIEREAGDETDGVGDADADDAVGRDA